MEKIRRIILEKQKKIREIKKVGMGKKRRDREDSEKIK
jgi:hypothetical protein